MKLRDVLRLKILLCCYCLYCIQVNADVADVDQIQLITQIEYCRKSEDFTTLANKQIIAINNITVLKKQIYYMQNNQHLTEIQKKHSINKFNNKILKLEKITTLVPSTIDFFAISNSLEIGTAANSSLIIKALYKNTYDTKLIAQKYQHFFEAEIATKIDLYRFKNYLFTFSPKMTFSPYYLTNYELRLIILQSKKNKINTRFTECQLAARFKKLSTQYCIDFTNGYKFDHGLMLFWQSFWSLEPKNPTRIYKNIIRNQLCIAKLFNNTPITLQFGCFRYNTLNKFNKVVANGLLASIWIDV